MSAAPSLSQLSELCSTQVRPATREELAECVLFDGVELSTLWGLLDRFHTYELKDKQVLIEPGESVRCLFLVIEGACTVHIGSKDSDPVATIQQGENVGELSLIDHNPRSAFVLARGTTRVVAIGPEAFWGLVHSSHEVTVNLLALMARRLRGNNDAVSQSRRLQAEYKRHASVDGLTGLYNRRRLDEVLPRYLSRAAREKSALCVLMTDVDHFKTFNDTHGHQAGDLVLFEVAKLLRQRCRPSDFVARYGGEEFTVVLPRANRHEGELVAERLRQAVEALLVDRSDGPPLRVTASIGLSEARSQDDVASIVRRADEALYAAKKAGRNRVYSAP